MADISEFVLKNLGKFDGTLNSTYNQKWIERFEYIFQHISVVWSCQKCHVFPHLLEKTDLLLDDTVYLACLVARERYMKIDYVICLEPEQQVLEELFPPTLKQPTVAEQMYIESVTNVRSQCRNKSSIKKASAKAEPFQVPANQEAVTEKLVVNMNIKTETNEEYIYGNMKQTKDKGEKRVPISTTKNETLKEDKQTSEKKKKRQMSKAGKKRKTLIETRTFKSRQQPSRRELVRNKNRDQENQTNIDSSETVMKSVSLKTRETLLRGKPHKFHLYRRGKPPDK